MSDAESLLDDDEFVNDRTDEIKDKDNRSALTDGSNSLTTVTRLAKKETMGFINQSDNSDAGEYTEPTTTSDHSENMSLLTEVTKDLQEGDELQQVENLLPNAGREIRIILDGEANGNPLCFSNSNGGNALEGNSALEVAHTDWKKGNNINQENVDDFSITFNNTASSEKYNEPQKECQEPVVSVATLLEGSSNMNYDAKIMDGNQEQDRNLMSSSGLELEKPLLKHDLGNLKSMKTIKKSLEFLEIIDITGPEVETLTRDLNSNTINPLGPVVPDICKETSV